MLVRLLVLAAATVLGGIVVPTAAHAASSSFSLYGSGGSSCSQKLTLTSAYGDVTVADNVTYDRTNTWIQVNSSINNADYRDCVHASGVRVGKVQLWNNYTFSGVKLDSCSAGFPSGFNCTITVSSSILTDASPSSCTNCSHLDGDQYGIKVNWYAGALTHYYHTARTVFTGTNGSTITVNANVDKSL